MCARVAVCMVHVVVPALQSESSAVRSASLSVKLCHFALRTQVNAAKAAESYTIPDSREGWVEAVRLVIDAHFLVRRDGTPAVLHASGSMRF